MPPITFPQVYNSWLECSNAAHVESVKLLETFDSDFVNKNQVGMKYTCRQGMVY